MAVRISRVYAMARPCRPVAERGLIERAASEIKATGSRREVAAAVAARVARIVVDQLRADELTARLAQLDAVLNFPGLAGLAFGDDAIAGEIMAKEAQADFAARGFRHPQPVDLPNIHARMERAIEQRLAERYRRA